MSEFKVGDKVECVSGGLTGIRFGAIYTVDASYERAVSVCGDDNVRHTYYNSSFVLVERGKNKRKKKEEPRKYILITESCNNIEVPNLKTKTEILEKGCNNGQYISDITTGKKYTIRKSLKAID